MMIAHRLHLLALVSGIPEPLRSAKVLVMLQAMIDESDSKQITPRVFVLGGYIASVRQWQRLADEWRAELTRPSRLSYFSFREAFPLTGRPRGRFNGLSEQERDLRVSNLRAIVERNVAAQIAIAFDVSCYQEAYASRPRLKNNHWVYAFVKLAASIEICMRELKLGKQTLDMIFDNRKIEEPNIIAAWFLAREQAKPSSPNIFK